jgi:GT2 family glycosyltransferase
MSARQSVVAAIPNYNMASSLQELLPAVMQQGYDRIVVLDDASTDHSLEVLRDFAPEVEVIPGRQNAGSGANRNRIIGQVGRKDVLHFIDADMRLDSQRTAERVTELIAPDSWGFVGGLVCHQSGLQHEFNFGPRQSLRNDARVPLHLAALALGEKHPDLEQKIRSRFPSLGVWPNPRRTVSARQTFWVSEANLAIEASTFEGLGGFDPKLRDHDIQDLAIRLHQKGTQTAYFDPSFAATHKAVEVREGNRNLSFAKAELYIARKNGIMKWLLSKDGMDTEQ